MASRLKLARAGAGVVGAAMVLMMAAAIPASAEDEGATGKVDGGALGLNVDVGDGFQNNLSTQLIGLDLDDGTKLGTYCVQIDQGLDRNEPLVETGWDFYPVSNSAFEQNADKINFILQNGFPQKNTTQLAKVLRNQGTALNDGALSVKEAVAGTQAAIWHFSDRTDLNQADPVPGDARDGADVLALYNFLIGPDNKGLADEPDAALALDPDQRSGTAGDRIGPFTVRTTGTIEKIAKSLPDGVRITDAQGRELRADQIVNGSKLFFDVPADTRGGAASFRLTANATVNAGRLFVSENFEDHPTQSLIVAQSDESQVVAKANADWSDSEGNGAPAAQGKNDFSDSNDDSGGLAETGASVLIPISIGGILILAGGGTLLFMRLRRGKA
jgi:TQXA domain-containing protein